MRAITATLSPVLTQEFSLHARDLGLLAGGYFLGFAAIQLPLGSWLDKYGPKRVSMWFLSLAVLGCMAFSFATCFIWLLAARMLLGMGVGICLMAPLTGYRCWFDASTFLRANPWMLMTGSLGVLASSVPVQWLMPLLGWRPMFWILALMIVLAIVCAVPRWRPGFFQLWRPGRHTNPVGRPVDGSSGSVHAAAGRHRPFLYQRGHAGYFLKLGTLNSWLAQYGSPADRLLLWGVPLSLVALAANIVFGTSIGYSVWAVFCIASSFQLPASWVWRSQRSARLSGPRWRAGLCRATTG